MTLQKIETFEHDIADEVLKKEESATRVAATDALVQDVQKEAAQMAQTQKASPLFLSIIIAIVVIVILGAGGYFAYAFFAKKDSAPAVPAKTAQPATPQAQNAPATSVSFFDKTFPELKDGMSRYVRKAEKNPYGFTLYITDYTSTFAFVVKNEGLFAESLANALDIPADFRSGAYVFTDATVANNNMRVGKSGESSVVYSFIGSNAIVISTSTDGVVQASGAIIR